MSRQEPLMRPLLFPKKTQRLSSQGGLIKIGADDDVPDSVLTAFQLAADSWAAKIKNKIPIYIQVINAIIDPELPMLVNAFYKEETMHPSALDAQFTQQSSDENSPDAMIFWNSELNWNCSFSNHTNNSGLNVYSYGLRAIAISLGFGSSVTQYDGDPAIVFQEPLPTAFDDLIFSGETRLSDLESGSQAIAEFVVKPNVYAFEETPEYKLYTPDTYTLGKSLVYLDNPNSIMHYQFGQDDKNFNIDEATITLLNQIGWNLAEPTTAKISCDKIGEDGVGSVYESYVFSLSENAEAYRWKLTLWSKNGQEQTAAQGNSPTFTVAPFTAIDNYARNASGDIEALVSCEYCVGNEWMEAKAFKLSLETKPQIISISEPEIVYLDNSTLFYARFTVEYVGAEMVTLVIEEDGDVNLRYFYVEEPRIAHVTTRNMNNLFYNWLDIKVVNKYGTATETLEFEPGESRGGAFVTTLHSETKLVNVYNTQGHYLGEYEADTLPKLQNGIYITKDCNGKTSKIIAR